jgi:hypothetical protein
MKLLRVIGAGLCLAVLGLVLVPNAKADEMDRKTVVKFSGPVEVPGVGAQVLPAGTYIFKVLDSPSDRHIVQITSEDGNHVFTTILAIPNYRLKATDKTVITFHERSEGQPEALRAWFYPGREWGEEFVYDRSRAIEIAKETNEAVLSTPVAYAATSGEALGTAPFEAVSPAGETVDTATVVEPPPVAVPTPGPALQSAPVAVKSARVATLPKTASDLPLVGLLGLLLLGTGFGLTSFAKRSA